MSEVRLQPTCPIDVGCTGDMAERFKLERLIVGGVCGDFDVGLCERSTGECAAERVVEERGRRPANLLWTGMNKIDRRSGSKRSRVVSTSSRKCRLAWSR